MNPFPDGGGGKDHTLLTRDDRAPIYTMVEDLRRRIPFLRGVLAADDHGHGGGKKCPKLPLVGTREVNLKTNLMWVNLHHAAAT